MLQYLYSISGKSTLTGQHCPPLMGSSWLSVVHRTTGHYPAVFGQDFGFSYPGYWDRMTVRLRFMRFADQLAEARTHTPYGTVMGHEARDFVWGSNAVAANQAMALLQAFRLTADSTYLWAALSNQDYLLGRNAIGYSFVTGFGTLSPMHPHHRPSERAPERPAAPPLYTTAGIHLYRFNPEQYKQAVP